MGKKLFERERERKEKQMVYRDRNKKIEEGGRRNSLRGSQR